MVSYRQELIREELRRDAINAAGQAAVGILDTLIVDYRVGEYPNVYIILFEDMVYMTAGTITEQGYFATDMKITDHYAFSDHPRYRKIWSNHAWNLDQVMALLKLSFGMLI